jgi:cytochrome c oxidase subunit 4
VLPWPAQVDRLRRLEKQMSDITAQPAAPAAEHHAEHPPVPYLAIACTLFVLTGITIGVSFVNLGKAGNVILAMAIASFKASLVILFFMHLKYEKKTMVIICLIPYLLAAVLLFALFPDVVYGQYH